MEAEFQGEILALEKKYLALYTPLYLKRAEYISGKTEPTDAEVTEGVSDGEDEDSKEEDDEDEEDKDAQPVEGKIR
jgi:nucleosome assembly protein 1-like 1